MKIVYVLTRSDVIGGASVHVLDLATGMRDAGHEVTILVGGYGVFNDRARERKLTCYSLKHLQREINILADVFAFLEIRSVLRNLRPDIVHLHSSKAGMLGRLASRALSIPAVFTAHGWAFTEGVSRFRSRFYLFIERFMTRFTDKIITVSNYDRQLALKSGVGDEGMMTTIHNGMPETVLSKCTSNNDPRLIMVARFDEPKDQNALLVALSELKDYGWTMEFVGAGPLIESAKQLSESLGLSERVLFSGECFDVSARLERSDIFVLISKWEGLPLTILEAMRAKLPIVASDVGGVKEAVEDELTGYLIPRGDRLAIINYLKLLIQSPIERSKMGLLGEKKFQREFTFSAMLEKTVKVYENVTAERL